MASPFELTMMVLWTLLFVRWLVFAVCAVIEHRRQRGRDAAIAAVADRPVVTVVIPCFNEAEVITATLRSVIASSYANLEVIVVDDGSTDATLSIARAFDYPGLRVLAQPQNAGKPAALNRGIQEARGQFIVTVDADTQLDEHCIRLLVQTILYTRANAVCANVKVGNRRGLIGRWQSLEYVTGLNIDRRAQCLLGVITTIPGAAAIWESKTLRAMGGFPADTLAEDTDLSIAMLRAGMLIEFADRAISRTEAPNTWRQLFKQRVRWLYGNLQCALKHSSVFWQPAPWKTRLFALPNLWFVHLGVYLLFPIGLTYLVGFRTLLTASLLGMFISSILSLDLLVAMAAYWMDQDDDAYELVHVPVQRIFYPFFLWSVFANVMVQMLTGKKMGWNKLERSGAMN